MPIARRDFLKGVGTIFGAAGLSSVLGNDRVNASNVREVGELTTRKRKYKYPWWVKQVDNITTEVDHSIEEPPPWVNAGAYRIAMKPLELVEEENKIAKEYVKEGIVNNIPGRTLPDLALHYAAHTYLTKGSSGSFDAPRQVAIPIDAHLAIENYNLHPPQDFGLPPWNATPEEASRVVEAAAVQLGASMVGFTMLNPMWVNRFITLDPEAPELVMDYNEGKFIIPEEYKYLVMFLGQGPRDLLIRNQSELGAAGDRAAYSRVFLVANNIIRFIRGLGYDAVQANMLGPVIPYAISAGLGELGRMNRMINPIFGGNVRIEGFLTNLPLAPDKPIDFGLQEFCKNCKICAMECPAGALSVADEPYWTPANSFQAPGKKAYFEDNLRCAEYISSKANYCSTCLSVCPWSKQDKAALHEIAKVTSAKLPEIGNFLTKMDQAFGYGLVEPESKEMADWWDLDIPEFGVDSYQGKF